MRNLKLEKYKKMKAFRKKCRKSASNNRID
jgi:hypothetical protein